MPGVVEQASAGVGMTAQRLAEPVLARYIEHQALAALFAAANMMGAGRDHHQVLLAQQAGPAVDFKVEQAGQTDHQLRMLMAVRDHVLAVMTQ